MGDSYSVKAILSAVDRGFSSTMKSALNITGKLESRISHFTTGMLQGAGQQAFGMLCSGASSLVSEIDSANAAWKTFNGNMKILGKSDKDINKVRKSMQKYAEATIYSSSDMASTYAQLSAVGVKSADKLVTGFGGLAAAAEDPTQAMKTLSQQATQMAGKPTVAWADFKLMMEQTPAGVAAVAKEMGMSTSDLVRKIQAGEIATNDFFDAVSKVGNSKGFSKLATESKTVGQAVDSLKETLANKLLPTWDLMSQKAIKSINGISDRLSKGVDGDALAKQASAIVKKAQPYWEQFKNVSIVVGNVIKKTGKFMLEHSNIISKSIPIIISAIAAYKGFQIVNSVIGSVKAFSNSILGLAERGSSAAEGLRKTAKGQTKVGKASMQTSTQMLGSAKAFMMLGAGVLMVAAGFGILALSAVKLAEAGPLAIATMFGLLVALIAVGAGMGLLLKVLAPMSAGMLPVAGAMLMLGGAIALVGAGVYLASAGLALLATQLPAIATYGISASQAIIALGTSLVVFAGGIIATTASILAFSMSLVTLGASLVVATAGMTVFGTSMIVSSAGALTLAVALTAVHSRLKGISRSAKSVNKSLNAMQKSVNAVENSFIALGNKAKSAGQKVGNDFANGIKTGLAKAPSQAKNAVKKVNTAFRSGRAGAYSAGAYISKGFAVGMKSQLSYVKNIASQLADAAEEAIRAKAKIHSPSRVTMALGSYYGEGFVLGIKSMLKDAYNMAEELVSVPSVMTPDMNLAYAGELSSDYSYNRQAEYKIYVPLEIDGKEFAKAEASYMQEEINRRESRDSRKRGKK